MGSGNSDGRGIPASLTSIHVDLTTRMGALTPATPTGLQTLDRMLIGGLRAGTLVAIAGQAGSGRTAFALLLAYMAARARAAVVFASVSLDETEIMARLAARALHREYPDARTPYGAIWSGQAWQDDLTRRPVGESVDTVVKKVGTHLHLYRAHPFESAGSISLAAAHLWGRYERVVVVVDDIEAFSAEVSGRTDATLAANSSYENRIAQVAFGLRHLAEQGCAVVTTMLSANMPVVSPAATLAAELRLSGSAPVTTPERLLVLGARPVDLVITKNRVGATGSVPLRFIPGAAVFEERGA